MVAQWKKHWFIWYNYQYTARNVIFFSCHCVYLFKNCSFWFLKSRWESAKLFFFKSLLFSSGWEGKLKFSCMLRIIHGMCFFLLELNFLLNTNLCSFASIQAIVYRVLIVYNFGKNLLCYCESDCALNHASSIKKFQISYQMK